LILVEAFGAVPTPHNPVLCIMHLMEMSP
jgi:hypothetical protein